MPRVDVVVPESLLRASLKIFRESRDLMVAKWIEHLETIENFRAACTGCSRGYCCRELAIVHPIEAMLIAVEILDGENLAMPPIDTIMRQGENQREANRFMQPCLLIHNMPDWIRELIVINASTNWYKRNEPCVFRVNDKCSIYAIRPAACATYYVQSRCSEQPPAGAESNLADNTELMLAVMQLGDGFVQEVFQTPPNHVLPPGPLTLEVARMLKTIRRIRNPEEYPRHEETAKA